MQVVDSHIHLWDLKTHRYPWLENPGVSFVGDARDLKHDYLLDDLLGEAGDIDVLKLVHVEANHDPAESMPAIRGTLHSVEFWCADVYGRHLTPSSGQYNATRISPVLRVRRCIATHVPLKARALQSRDIDQTVSGGMRRALGPIVDAEVEADLAPLQLQSSLERFARLRSKALEQRALTALRAAPGPCGLRSPCRRSSSRSRTCTPASSRCSRRTSPARRPRSRRAGRAPVPTVSEAIRRLAGPRCDRRAIPCRRGLRSACPESFRRRVPVRRGCPCPIPSLSDRPGALRATVPVLAGLRWPPVGTGISVSSPLSSELEDDLARLPRTPGARAGRVAARARGSGRRRAGGPGIRARGRTGSPPASRSSRSLASPRSPDGRNAGSRRAAPGRSPSRRRADHLAGVPDDLRHEPRGSRRPRSISRSFASHSPVSSGLFRPRSWTMATR